MVGGYERSYGARAGRHEFGSEQAHHDAVRSGTSSQDRDGGSGISSARGGGGPHRGVRGK
jgi:hypothetical protein